MPGFTALRDTAEGAAAGGGKRAEGGTGAKIRVVAMAGAGTGTWEGAGADVGAKTGAGSRQGRVVAAE